MFIAIEGCDGSGKGAQIEKLKAWFKEAKLKAEFFHDPGCTKLSESIRALLLGGVDMPIAQRAEMGLFMASRSQLVVEKILPTLRINKIVLVDRYLLSTVVYQGYAYAAHPVDIDMIWKMGTYMAHGVLPDLTFVLDCSAERALKRLNRPKDRIEQKALEYHRRVVDGYRNAVDQWEFYAPGRAVLINAEQKPEEVFEDIKKTIIDSRLFKSDVFKKPLDEDSST